MKKIALSKLGELFAAKIRQLRQRQARPELFCFNVCSTGSAVFFRSVG